jgi:signal transduction histidine kinase
MPGLTRSRSTLIVILLVAMLGMTAMLAYEAQQAARSHRATAEGVLRDYASFAAWELSRQSRQQLLERMNHGIQAVRGAQGRGDLALAVRGRATCASGCANGMDVQAAFHVRLPERTVSWSSAPTPDVAAAIDRIVEHGMQNPDDFTCPSFEIVSIAGQPAAIVWRPSLGRDNRASELIGFVTTPAFIAQVFEKIVGHDALLPPSLAGPGASPNDRLAVRVNAPDGQALFASTAEWSPFDAGEQLPAAYGRLAVSVALRPEAAGHLVIGGLPRERLPLIGGLLGLTAALVVVAVVQLRREAEIARLRSDFVSGVSHELRTPLAQIRMFTETLLLGRVRSDGEARRSLEIVGREAQRLSQLVENVLLFSRGERHRPGITREVTRVAPLVSDVAESFTPLAGARRATIRTDLDPHVMARIDAGAIRQVLLNLLDNAVKYGPAGQSIRVTLSAQGERLRLAVEDEGPGIAPADASRIWQPFHRLAQAGTAAGGAGIGLAIVRQLVELHGGSVRVEAGVVGARFVVELPGAWRDSGAAVA